MDSAYTSMAMLARIALAGLAIALSALAILSVTANGADPSHARIGRIGVGPSGTAPHLAGVAEDGERVEAAQTGGAQGAWGPAGSSRANAQRDGSPPCRVMGRLLLPTKAPAVGAQVEMVCRTYEAESDGRQARLVIGQQASTVIGQQASTTTDSFGRFELACDPWREPALDVYEIAVEASMAGYATLAWQRHPLKPGYRVDVGEQVFVPSSSVEGRVLGVDGAPTGAAWRVTASGAVGSTGLDSVPTSVAVQSDVDTGEFRLEGVPVGPVRLIAEHPAVGWVGPSVAEVHAGHVARADIVYVGADLRRCITVARNTAPYLVRTRGDRGESFVRAIASDGVVHVAQPVPGMGALHQIRDLPDDAYVVEVGGPLHDTWRRTGVRPGELVEAQLRGNASVGLSVTNESGSPIDRYDVQVRLSERARRFASPRHALEILSRDAERPPEGVIEGLLPLESTLIVRAEGYGSWERVIRPRAGEITRVAARLRLSGQLTVRVVDESGAPVDGADVTVHAFAPDFAPLGPRRTGRSAMRRLELVLDGAIERTDPDGVARFEGLAATQHGVLVDAGPLVAHEPRVTVPPGGEAEVELTLAVMGTIRGRVAADVDGVFEGMTVSATWTPGGQVPGRSSGGLVAELDGRGAFELRHAPAGNYVLWLLSSSVNRSPGPISELPIAHQRAEIARFEFTPGRSQELLIDGADSVPGRIDARVRVNGELAAGVTVELFNEEGLTIAGGVTDSRGHLPLERIAPGTFTASLRPLSGEWSHAHPHPIAVTPGEELALTFEVTH